MKILGIAGSLRKNSCNVGLLRAAKKVLPKDTKLEIYDLGKIPLYNQDIEETNFPSSVKEFKEKIRAADVLLITTAEYNYSISGVLKNAIDWASRPYGDSAWNDKIVGITGASPSELGSSRAQYHLRQIFVTLNMHPLNKPELMIGSSFKKFDDKGDLTDPKTLEKLAEFLKALIDFARFRRS